MAFLHDNYSLKQYNTFGIDVTARYFFEFQEVAEIQQFLKDNPIRDTNYLILGGGSNLLFTEDFDGLVIHPKIKGIEIVREDEDHVWVKAGAYEEWDDFVAWSVNNQYSGIENLSLIPGKVGATPVQNIGAYGVEVQEVITEVEAISIETGSRVTLSNAQCEFGYRDSIFKNELKNLFIVTSVTYQLSKKPNYKTHYGSLSGELENYSEINLQNIREVIIKIRESKLPDPKEIGNAGSFFKNPVIDTEVAGQLQKEYPKIPLYPVNGAHTKVAAGWLIEQCGWKGKQIGNAGVHKDQALVLINCGKATGLEISHLANEIRKSVILKFGITLEMEVNAV
ncbi:MAG: UDP-N-acetylmuramate dehydrogenase [Marinifilaceae bacterium]